MHSTSIFQLILSVLVNAHIYTVSGNYSPTFIREGLTLAHDEPLKPNAYRRFNSLRPEGLTIPDRRDCLDPATAPLSCSGLIQPKPFSSPVTSSNSPAAFRKQHIVLNRLPSVKKKERYIIVFEDGNQPKSLAFQGPPTRKMFQAIQTQKPRGKSAWLFQELDHTKNEWNLEEVKRVGYRLPTLSEKIKQTIFTKGAEDLNIVSTVGLKEIPKPASSQVDKPLDTEGIAKAYREADGTRLIISDYDGTLREFVDNPEAATPSPELLSDLETLSLNKNNMVWLVSGRDKRFLSDHFGHIKNIGLKAAYGAATRDPISGQWETMRFDKTSLDSIKTIMEAWSSSVTHSHIEDKDFGLAYHYRVAHTQDLNNQVKMTRDATQAKQDIDLIYKSEAEFLKACLDQDIQQKGLPLVTILGNMVVEVKSKHLSKEEAVQSLYHGIPHPDFVLVGGDDPADEVMFKVAHKKAENAQKTAQGDVKPPVVATVHVSHNKGQETSAKYMVTEPKEFRELLSKMSFSDTKETPAALASKKGELSLASEKGKILQLSS